MTAQQTFDGLVEELAEQGAVNAPMFGKPGIKLGKTAFACLFGDGLAVKLGAGTAEHQRALDLPGAVLFDPSGRDRPFKDWVVVPHASNAEWSPLAQAALARAGAG